LSPFASILADSLGARLTSFNHKETAMFLRFALVCLIAGAISIPAQQTSSAVAEPQYTYEFAALGADGSLIPLEKQKLLTQHETHNRFIYVNGTVEQTVQGERSSVRLPGNTSFVVRLFPNMESIDPNTLVALKPFVVKKGQRQIPEHSGKATMFTGVKGQAAADTSIALTFKKYGQSSLEITPTQPLPPGEYVLAANGGAQAVSCFGVDSGSATATAPAAHSAPPAPPPAPPRPTHPASTVVDLPAAAPGYPPIHASAPAKEGCWWVPYHSEKLQLEMAVANCDGTTSPTPKYVDSASGLQLIDPNDPANPVDIFTVHTKTADQSIETAIHQQFILKMKKPIERTSCKVKRDDHDIGVMQSYTVFGTAPYINRKEFNDKDGPPEAYPCDELAGNDVISASFLYNPTESKTKFLFLHGQGEYMPLVDSGSIHFASAQQ
jgi:hypothetical protein